MPVILGFKEGTGEGAGTGRATGRQQADREGKGAEEERPAATEEVGHLAAEQEEAAGSE